MASSELETISNLAFQIKYQNAEIRATKRLLLTQVEKIENKHTAEVTISEEALCYQRKPKRMRKRDLITYKLKNNLELTKSEKRTWEKKPTSHIWSQCPNLKECTNVHCWITQKTQICSKCKDRTTSCTCTTKLVAIKCQQCEETSRNCKCGLPKERNIQDELASAMASYRGTEEVRSIGQLIALMAGGGSSEKRCVYDNKRKMWVPRKFEPLPKGDFEWECLGSGSKGTT